MTVVPSASPRRTLPEPVVRLLGMAGFVAAATLGWRLLFGDADCLVWTSAVLTYLAGDIVHGHRARGRPALSAEG